MITINGKECKRILYKISGECLMGDQTHGYDVNMMRKIGSDIAYAKSLGIEICLVVGGGNIYRGAYGEKMGMDRAVADYMGMMATVMNAIALQNILEQEGVPARVQSAIPITAVCEPYIRRRAMRHLEKGRVVIFAAGIGNPFFTTDTTATLRSLEMNCDLMLKGTSVDGIYSADPKVEKTATRFDTITYKEVIEKNLRVMDISAVSMARDRKMPIIVFSIKQENALQKILSNQCKYTIIQ
jgi:uridylate kinase